MRFRILLLAAALVSAGSAALAAAPAAASSAGAQLPPDQVVEQTAEQMFQAIHHQRAELQRNPRALYKLVGDILLPHFDFDYASRLVLGPYWRTATPAQRKAFENAFYKYLVHSYANGLLQGNYSKRNIEVEPWRGGADDTRAMVRSKVLRSNGPPVEVDYAMVRTRDGWKAFDVTIEGISYVMNYRNQFGPEVQAKGLDELIARLNAEADRPAPPPSAAHGSQ